MAQQFLRHVGRGMTLIHATTFTSTVPARILGLADHAIVEGAPLNLVVLDSNGTILKVWTPGPIL